MCTSLCVTLIVRNSQCLCFYFALLLCIVNMHLTLVCLFLFHVFGAAIDANKDVYTNTLLLLNSSVAAWLACRTQAQ